MVESATQKDRILSIVGSGSEPASRGDLLSALETSESRLDNLLSEMVGEDLLFKPSRGLYALPNESEARVEKDQDESDTNGAVTYPLTRAGAGPGRTTDDSFQVDRRLIESEVGHVPDRDEAFWCRINGSSMEPWIQDGSFCFALRQKRVSEPGRYIVWWGQDQAQVCLYLAQMSQTKLLGRKYGPEKEYHLDHVEEDMWRVEGYDEPIRMIVKGRVVWPRSTAQGVLETVTDQMGKMLEKALD